MSDHTLSHHQRALELPKVLAMLAKEAPCEDCARLALELTPSSDLHEVEHLLAQTQDAHMLIGRFGSPSFGGLKNMANAMARANAGGSLSMRELLDIAENLRVMRSLTDWRAHCEGVASCLDDIFSAIFPNKYLENRIHACILSEEEMADAASPTLHDIRRKMRAASSKVREQLDKLVRSPAYQRYLQDPIVTIRSDRFVVPVKAEHRADVPGLVHDTSSSGATVFVEPIGAVQANNELKVLKAKEAAEIERILFELSAEVGSFSESLSRSYALAVELGLIFSKARLAYAMKASVPAVNEAGKINLKKARHPLIDPKQVVATDIVLGYQFDTLVITGPNTGGKTVALKTVGLLTLMTMCGLMIPVSDGSAVSLFDHVLADIGDEQSIEQSLSTFSAHMTNIIAILDEADNRSLVLLDELGAGTDPIEGAALAMAILENLRAKGARLCATTHYAELKAYALQTPGVENGCCEFDVKTLRPTYRLLIGIPGRSNAFAISERLGMPAPVVERARALVSAESTKFEDVVDKLEQSRQSMEERRQEAEAMRLAAERAAKEANDRLARMERDRDRELEAARVRARDIVEQAKRQAHQLMDELDALRKQKDAAQFSLKAAQAKAELKAKLRRLDDLADPVKEQSDEDYVLPRPLKVGDTVLITSLGTAGTVISLPDSKGNVEVQAGIIKTRVPLKSVRLTAAKKAKPARSATRSVTSRAAARAETSVDLRGKAADEALMDLDQFIDQSLLNGIEEITIIHGKGTGVLRTAVQKHLRTHPSILTFRSGVYGEGEQGVTIAQLK